MDRFIALASLVGTADPKAKTKLIHHVASLHSVSHEPGPFGSHTVQVLGPSRHVGAGCGPGKGHISASNNVLPHARYEQDRFVDKAVSHEPLPVDLAKGTDAAVEDDGDVDGVHLRYPLL